MKFTFLGTGTSVGVPQIGCHCKVCSSTDWHDNRMRASGILSVDGVNLLIDCGPDFRSQILRAGSPQLHAALLTHTHYDHVGGIDDLRPYCKNGPFPVYCLDDVARDLRARVPYCFYEHLYPGVPKLDLRVISPQHTFDAAGVSVTPLPVMHGKLPIIGFRIRNFAYVTDCSMMPESTLDLIKGVDTLVINSLRPQKHPTHFCLEESIDVVGKVKPRIAFFTHMSHDMGLHTSTKLPQGVHLAYDTLSIDICDQ